MEGDNNQVADKPKKKEPISQLHFPKSHINISKKAEAFYIYYGKEIIACITQDIQTDDAKYKIFIDDQYNEKAINIPPQIIANIQEAIRHFNPGAREQKPRQALLENFLQQFPLFAPEYKDKIDVKELKEELQYYSDSIQQKLQAIEIAYDQNIFYSEVYAGNNSRKKLLHENIKEREKEIELSQKVLTKEDQEKITFADEIYNIDIEIHDLEKKIRKVKKFAREKDTLLDTIKEQLYKVSNFENLSERTKRKLSNINKDDLTAQERDLTTSKEQNMLDLLNFEEEQDNILTKRKEKFNKFLLTSDQELQNARKESQKNLNTVGEKEINISNNKQELQKLDIKSKQLWNQIRVLEQELNQTNNMIDGILKSISKTQKKIAQYGFDQQRKLQREQNLLSFEDQKQAYQEQDKRPSLLEELNQKKEEYSQIGEERAEIHEVINQNENEIKEITMNHKKLYNIIMKEINNYHIIQTKQLSEEEIKKLQWYNENDKKLHQQTLDEEKNIEAKLKQYEAEIAFLCDGIKKENNEINYTESGLSALWDDKILPYGIELYNAREDNQKKQTKQEKQDYKGQDYKAYKEQVKKLLWEDYIWLIITLRNWIDIQKPNFKHHEIKEFSKLSKLFLWSEEDEKQLNKMKKICETKIWSDMRVEYGIGDEIGKQQWDILKEQYEKMKDEIQQLEWEKEFLRILNEKYRHHLHAQKRNKIEKKVENDIEQGIWNQNKPWLDNEILEYSNN